MAFFRWLFVTIIVSPILILNYQKIWNSLKHNFLILMILAILGITAFNTILYVGLTMTTATNALIINSSIPIIILFLSFVILNQKININQTLGILISTLGVVYIILQGNFNQLFTLEFNQGDIWVIASSLSWALYSVAIKFKPKDLNDFEFFATIVFLGFICLTPIYLYQGYTLENEIALVSEHYFIFGYVSIFASSLSYYFWHYGIKEIGAPKTAQFTHLMPIFGAILAYIFLGEVLQSYHIFGAILIGFGIYLSLFYKSSKT